MLSHVALIILLLTCVTANARPDNPIAIVGAGFSGVASAYHLMEAGHTNITIYEATSRPGGFITSVRYKNVTHDMTTYGLTDLYWKFITFAKGLGFSFCPFGTAVVLPTTPATVLDASAFVASQSVPTLSDPTQYTALLQEQITRYTELWSFLYEIPFINERLDTDRLFPARPTNKDKLRRLSVPMLKFLQQENLELLIPILKLKTDTSAYGPIETTSAVYFMSWNPPSVLLPTAQTFVPCDIGFGDILQAMVDRLQRSGKVTFQYGSRVTEVRRGRKDAKVITDDGAVDRYRSVITTGKLNNKEQRNIVTPLTPLEKRASKKMEALEIFSVLLEGSRETAVANDKLLNIISRPIAESRPNSAFWGATNQELRSPDGPFHSDMDTIVKVGYLLYHKERSMRKVVKTSRSMAVRRVLKGMLSLDSTVWRPIQGIRNRNYFQRWRPKKVREGLPWALEEVQGLGNVYYVNSAACGFESIGHLFDCSERVVKLIKSD